MQITETSAEGLKREFKVVVAAADIEQKVTSRLKELSQTVRMPGFRPGKVPMSMLKKRFGQHVMGEVLEQAVGDSSAQAIAWFSANSPMPAETIRSEIRRYIVLPGQATSYKVGMIKIQQLRAEAERELGDEFDIRAFHDVVLGGGSLPLSLLERRVRAWIAERKAG